MDVIIDVSILGQNLKKIRSRFYKSSRGNLSQKLLRLLIFLTDFKKEVGSQFDCIIICLLGTSQLLLKKL